MCGKKNPYLYRISIYRHPPYAATDSSEKTAAQYRGLTVYARMYIYTHKESGYILDEERVIVLVLHKHDTQELRVLIAACS